LIARLEAAPTEGLSDETWTFQISGFAGLAAAIEAKQAGASVMILEKMI